MRYWKVCTPQPPASLPKRLEACNISAAFDRRIRFDGNKLVRLMPDGSGPEIIDLAAYKRIFAIAIGKAACPMLDTLLDRMKRRKGLRGICCSNQMPRKRNWRFPLFRGWPPTAQRRLLCRRPRHSRAAPQSPQRYPDFLSHLRRRLGAVRPPARCADHARRHPRLPHSAARLRRAHQ